MNIIKKMAVAMVVLAAVCGTKLSAQEFFNFQSKETGICVTVPGDMEIVNHDETILQLQTDLVVFSVHPMLSENLTVDAVTELIGKTADSAGLDLKKMETDEIHNETVDILAYSGKNADGVITGIGLIQPKMNDKIIFLMTLTYADGAGDKVAGTIINSLEFNPDIIE